MIEQEKATPEKLEISLIADEHGFAALKPEWNRIAGACPGSTVFQRHEWFDAAWQWRRHNAKLFIMCVYRGGSLIGVCPMVATTALHARMQVRMLEFLTVPDTQACDLLATPEDAASVAWAVASELHSCRKRWDVIQLSHLQPDALARDSLFRAFREKGLIAQLAPAGGNPYIDLTVGWEAFYATRGRRLKKSNNLVANRLRKAGELEIEWLRPGSAASDVERALVAAIDISSRSWKEVTGRTLDNPAPGDFIRRLSELACEQGWLSLWLLRLGGKTVAMEYQIVHDGKVHALRADYDNDFRELSPGSYLNWKLLEASCQHGFQTYFMGPGDNPYKFRWTESMLPLSRLTVYSTTWKGHLAAWHDLRLAPAVRKISAWLKGFKPRKTDEDNET